MSKYNFSEEDFKNLEKNFPTSFLHLNYLKSLRENEELRTYCNKINTELNELKDENENMAVLENRIDKN